MVLVEWMMRRTHRRLCVSTEEWLEPGERTADVAVGNPTWTMWPCFAGMALLLLGGVVADVTDELWPGLALGLAGFACLAAPVVAVPSTIVVTTTSHRALVLDASPFRSTPRRVRASLSAAAMEPGRRFLGGRILGVAGSRLWVGSFWARHLPV